MSSPDGGGGAAHGRGKVTVAELADYPDRLDVRSPAEFADDHIPGAVSLPVLDDAQRAEVGTLHAQVSAFAAKRRGAALVTRNIARILETHCANQPREWRPLVYCWRGGKRSGALAHILSEIGWRAVQLDGGYRAYRRHVITALETLPARFSFHVICGADHVEREARGQCFKRGDDMPAIGAITAIELDGPPADFGEDVRKRAAAFAAAPAVDEGPPFPWLVRAVGFKDARDIAGDECGAAAFGGECGNLRVQRAHFRALCVVQHGQAHGPRHMVVGKLGGAAHIEAIRVIGKLRNGNLAPSVCRATATVRRTHPGLPSNGFNVGQILSSSRDCVSALG